MRVFTKYTPKRIARYVMSFFSGTFLIEGLGVFHFNYGRVIIDSILSPARMKVCREVNSEIAMLMAARA
ncbi:MAG: DUF1107 family protein [Succinatimonas hippei]|nr:DUF1107 family protein [Succinatimonas hippei]